jgi:chromosome segregation ATPase
MIEDGLFLGLGFCVATLLALACLPFLWARALRLTRERLALLVPSSQAEIDAARDGLRAQAAVAQRRLEQRIEAEQRATALTKSELGHRTLSLVNAEKAGEVLRADKVALLRELAGHVRELHDSEGQRGALEKALHDADARIETAAAEARRAAQRQDQLSQLADERRGAIAALETRAAGLLAKLEDGQERIERLETEVAGRTSAQAALAAELDALRTTSASLRSDLVTAQQALANERERAVTRDERLRQRSDALAAAEVRMAEQDQLIKQEQAELAALRSRLEGLEAELRARGEGSPADPQDSTRTDALLRSAIIAVGDDALRLLKPASEDQSQPPDPDALRVGERQP